MNLNDPKIKKAIKQTEKTAKKQIRKNIGFDFVSTCKNIQEDRHTLSLKELEDKYKSFYDKHEPIFMMAATRTMTIEDFENLKAMLDMMKLINNKQLSYTQASQAVSYTAAKKYAPELLNKNLKKIE